MLSQPRHARTRRSRLAVRAPRTREPRRAATHRCEPRPTMHDMPPRLVQPDAAGARPASPPAAPTSSPALRRRPRDRRVRGRAGAPRRAHRATARRRTTSSGATGSAPYDLTVYQLGQLVAPRLSVALPLPLSRADGAARRASAPCARGGAAAHAPARPTTAPSSPRIIRTPAPIGGAGDRGLRHPPLLLLADDPAGRRRLEARGRAHPRAARTTAAESPDARVDVDPPGHGTPLSPDEAAAPPRRGARPLRHRRRTTVVFGCFGGLTPDKRLPQILDAFAAIRARACRRASCCSAARRRRTTICAATSSGAASIARVDRHRLPRRPTTTLTERIAACDVALNLRWPTAREVSGPVAALPGRGRCRPSSIDLAHLAGRADARRRARWQPRRAARRRSRSAGAQSRSTSWTRTIRCGWRCGGWRSTPRCASSSARRRAPTGSANTRSTLMIEDYRRLLPLAASLPRASSAGAAARISSTTASALTARLLAAARRRRCLWR